MKVGRVTLRTPNDVESMDSVPMEDERNALGESHPVDTGRDAQAWRVTCTESDASANATVESLLKEKGRDLYVDDSTDALLASGYYKFKPGASLVRKMRGAPTRREFDFVLTEQDWPEIVREAEDDNVAGTDTTDKDRSNKKVVRYTPTAVEVLVLDPRNVAGAEKVNLPQGTHRIQALVKGKTTTRLRVKTTKTDGTQITNGSQVSPAANDAWGVVTLGDFTIAAADAGANWYELRVDDPTATDPIDIDYVIIARLS